MTGTGAGAGGSVTFTGGEGSTEGGSMTFDGGDSETSDDDAEHTGGSVRYVTGTGASTTSGSFDLATADAGDNGVSGAITFSSGTTSR